MAFLETRGRHARLAAQLKTQEPFRISVQRFDDQRRVGACQPRHVEFELGLAKVAGLDGKLRRLGSALDAGSHGSPAHGLVSLIANGDLQQGALPGEPGLGVDQLEMKNLG